MARASHRARKMSMAVMARRQRRRRSSSHALLEDGVERGAHHAARFPFWIAAQSLADRLDVGAVLQGEREDDRGIPRVDIDRGIDFVIRDEGLGGPAVCELAIGASEAEPSVPEIESDRAA